jgi:asparagine synthase (glutamine-hydrolysing)
MLAYGLGLKRWKVKATIRNVISNHLSYYDEGTLLHLAHVAINNEKRHLKGAIIEAGCALGGSAITLAAAKSKERMLLVYDVFGPHPPPTNRDGPDALWRHKVILEGKSTGINGDLYYGYESDLYNKVLRSFADFGLEATQNNVYLKRGLFEDTLKVESPVSLGHIDCDWYDSVLTCLNHIEPHLVRGGTLIINDYWSSSRKAIDKYFGKMDKNDYNFTKKTILFITKKE